MLLALRTFAASLVVPGLGFWIVDRPRLGLFTALGLTGLILVFCWTRLIIEPVGFIVYAGLIVGIILWAATYSAVIEFTQRKHSDVRRKWKPAIAFGVIFGLVLYLLTFNRSMTLGYETFQLPSSSMAPTLVRGDFFVIDSWRYRSSDIEYGDLVVFEVTNPEGVIYIKRIVGLPGDTISFGSDFIARNGVRIDEPYAFYTENPIRPSGSYAEVEVPSGEYFVLGDNRNNSRDSRFIGTIPLANIGGRAEHIWYSYGPDEGVRWERFPARVD